MTIDQRIEALTQGVELLSHMHQDNEKLYAKLFQRLTSIAEIHEKRISDLEQKRD